MKNLVLAAALMLAGSSAFASVHHAHRSTRVPGHGSAKVQNMDPLDFVGNYDLVHESLGLCEIEMNVGRYDTYPGQVDLTAGSAFFQNINAAPYVLEDKWSKRRIHSYVTGRTLVQEEITYDKLLKQTEHRKYSITLSADHKIMTYRSTSPSSSIGADLPFLCTYKFSPLPDPDQVETDVGRTGH